MKLTQLTMVGAAAAVLAVLGAPGAADANEGHHNHAAFINGNGMLVGNQDENDSQDQEDVVSVAEPKYYVRQPVYTTYAMQYVPVNDSIVTPYGYAPQDNNGYYQGYAYNPQYGTNPYYAGAAYGNADPLSSSVVGTIVNAVSNGGHVDGSTLIQALLGGLLSSQAQQPYQQQYQPQYQPQYGYAAPRQYAPVQYIQQVVQPQQYAPRVYYVKGHRGHHGHHGEGDHQNGDHNDNGND